MSVTLLIRTPYHYYNEIKNILNNHYPILWISSKNLQWSVADFLSPFPVIKLKENLS